MSARRSALAVETPPAVVPGAPPAVVPDAEASARAASLRYVLDSTPGITRRRSGRGFRHFDVGGSPLRDHATLSRIRSLAIPPAWTSVWICPRPDGHIQATGRDARGRKQYRYHPRFRERREQAKYDRLILFGETLPALRARVEKDLALSGSPKEKILALVVRLLETTLIRIGNREYTRQNRSFGLTTLRERHVDVQGSTIRFEFRGKSGKQHTVEISDRRLARLVRRCQEMPGQELFQYYDETGERQTIGSSDVNAYLREATGEEFTAKDFRTWSGTVLAALALRELRSLGGEAPPKKALMRAIGDVAGRLGNTPVICRKCYVHPVVLDAYMEGTTIGPIRARSRRSAAEWSARLRPEEAAVLAFLRRRRDQPGQDASARGGSTRRRAERS